MFTIRFEEHGSDRVVDSIKCDGTVDQNFIMQTQVENREQRVIVVLPKPAFENLFGAKFPSTEPQPEHIALDQSQPTSISVPMTVVEGMMDYLAQIVNPSVSLSLNQRDGMEIMLREAATRNAALAESILHQLRKLVRGE